MEPNVFGGPIQSVRHGDAAAEVSTITMDHIPTVHSSLPLGPRRCWLTRPRPPAAPPPPARDQHPPGWLGRAVQREASSPRRVREGGALQLHAPGENSSSYPTSGSVGRTVEPS